MKLGLIHNPRSARNIGAPVPEPPAGAAFAAPVTGEELADAVRRFAAEGVELVMINGGDGSVREVLTALPQAYGSDWPKLAVFAGGGTNLIAADVGAGRLEPGLQRITSAVAEGRPLPIRTRRALRIVWPDGERPPVIGMFMGAAAVVEATDLGERSLRSKGALQGPMVAMTIAATLFAALAGPARRRWLAGQPLGVGLDGDAPDDGRRFLLVATTLDRLMLGLWPFWTRDEGVRWFEAPAQPPRLLRGLKPLLSGQEQPWMRPAGYRSGAAESLALRLSDRFIVDGERFRPGPSGLIRLEAGPMIEFVGP